MISFFEGAAGGRCATAQQSNCAVVISLAVGEVAARFAAAEFTATPGQRNCPRPALPRQPLATSWWPPP
ncbi:hypothetical protein [Hymenobacter wooponensis]|uniref:Uncharacterized protein n=1 Tax=Hymenobacter wooponensis TaxID=1525360 RepID=A0A4Z0MDN1_9BACT|nr:hypothetical protein [Hymenobacter wooponensis]TGD77611.1 hypothetical protein EU557_22820 [Hymenobacter wooponensis]